MSFFLALFFLDRRGIILSKIVMNEVASYKKSTELITDKKVNLIYGLNGTGKSTLSNFMSNISDSEFSKCNIEGLTENDEILVYNQNFINNNFYESETLKGIFTLSQENKDAKQNIDIASKKVKELEKSIAQSENDKELIMKKKSDKKTNIEDKVWDIKKKYADDIDFEYCFDGLKVKSKLFDYVLNIKFEKADKSIEEIQKEIHSINSSGEEKVLIDEKLFSHFYTIENPIFKKIIIGNDNSTISNLIKKLENSDWVKSGLKYVDIDSNEVQNCPFCQSKTINKKFIDNIQDFFNKEYENDIELIKKIKINYSELIMKFNDFRINFYDFTDKESTHNFEIEYNKLENALKENMQLIDKKISSPSSIISLIEVDDIIEKINNIIKNVNSEISEFNEKINNRNETLNNLKQKFWNNIRGEYDLLINSYLNEEEELTKKKNEIDDSINNFRNEISRQNNIIEDENKKTINIDDAINNININLNSIGIGEFYIKKVDNEDLYRIERENEKYNVFKSLSEGEKMIISFLYFIEMCRGITNRNSSLKRKIIVIDDPITSLSHVYIYNVGRMIRNEFLENDKYEQIFILTHSLYFFYELTCMKKEDRDEKQKLFRIVKNQISSKFQSMHYQEIQNDYQAYWSIIKDKENHPALIANCMRNIIEYFFGFVEKSDVNVVFQKESLQENRFQAFNRYINRESHSIGQNIFDLKEFNYDDFRDAFRLVFIETKYEEHYEKMNK